MSGIRSAFWMIALSLSGAATARAYTIQPPGTENAITQVPGGGINTIVNNIWSHGLNIAFAIFGGLAIAILIWGGIQYIAASGSPEGAKKARQTMVNAVIAIVVMTAAYAIIAVVGGFSYFLANQLK